jgi:hypothetical protein
MFSKNQCVNFEIFVKKLIGKDEFNNNEHHNKQLEDEILSNLFNIYELMYSEYFTGKYRLLWCFKN